ncbi:alpha-1,2-fucosyltransferase [Flavobacterium pectinovorum]|uniref:alpha-1,2-fucosyltransferase n=1 Tax=Flavobacterium pectinovorum TaxID=29533 RepID=UPI001FABA02C|nr:alpha-1,2-fucosyltransferase [Flavobacterium pectinovorum]MCI9843892.1 alpha-1,2-fucosyltransferase [Flavobacterium pectinovorum]
MITFSRLGNKGKLGNQLFQIASTMSLAEKFSHECSFPNWDYSKYFEKPLPVFKQNLNIDFELLKEERYGFYDWNLEDKNYNIDGWLQSEKYFKLNLVKELFQFEKIFDQELCLKYKYLFKKKTILISVRRGDFVKHPFYYQLSHQFYLKSIISNFPDWKSRNLIFTSDDINYCKYHFSFLKNSFFLENLSAIEQLALGSKCDDFVISNSTFSWWIAWLGEQKETKIVRPIKNFRGSFAKHHNDFDYFPERWISFDDQDVMLESRYILFYLKGMIYDFLFEVKFQIRRVRRKLKRFNYIIPKKAI